MKGICRLSLFIVLLASCRQPDKIIVSSSFVDSLINHYSASVAMVTNDSNINFWKRRMEAQPDDYVNGPEYASALSMRFRLYAGINDLLTADSLFERSNEANREQEPGIFRTLASLNMLQHKFRQADSILQKAIKIEGPSLPNCFLDFDISFELGRYAKAKNLLTSLQLGNSYGYLFRRSKLEHYNGSLDTAITYMLRAAKKAGNNNYLKQAALSNAADLYVHKGNLDEACRLYIESIQTDAGDYHSIMGLGWIALVHDKNELLAEKIFQFVSTHSNTPDVLLKWEQLAETKNDSAMKKKYADKFVMKVNDSKYGGMYSKYLIDLYTGILHEPGKAVMLAEREMYIRPTPQVMAWYCWSLFCDNKPGLAYRIYRQFVSGKPLEGLELYYMGKLMAGLQRKYNAQQFLNAAYKNRYDLSPFKQKDLEHKLD